MERLRYYRERSVALPKGNDPVYSKNEDAK